MNPEAFAARFDVSRETTERLRILVETLRKWSGRINLVGRSTLADAWRRHVADSAQLLDLAPEGAATWTDLGSGAGFPALVVAAMAQERRPGLRVTAVESDARKCAFMRDAARRMGTAITVAHGRVEEAALAPADVVSARALASLERLLALAAPILADGAVCLFPKGAHVDAELTEAARRWHYRVERTPSITDPGAAILRITELRRAGPSP